MYRQACPGPSAVPALGFEAVMNLQSNMSFRHFGLLHTFCSRGLTRRNMHVRGGRGASTFYNDTSASLQLFVSCGTVLQPLNQNRGVARTKVVPVKGAFYDTHSPVPISSSYWRTSAVQAWCISSSQGEAQEQQQGATRHCSELISKDDKDW